jgi:hypothetical protein
MLTRKACRPAARAFATAAAILIAFLCQFFHPVPALAAEKSECPTVRLHGFRGASPQGSSYMPAKAVLRLIVRREEISPRLYRETLECGHQVNEFQPWIWDDGAHLVWLAMSAKRRRCRPCQEAIDLATSFGVKKPAQSVRPGVDWRKVA